MDSKSKTKTRKDANPTGFQFSPANRQNEPVARTILSDSPNEGESKMCGHEQSVKDGKDKNGFQRFKCKLCKVKFTEPHAMAGRRTDMVDVVRVLSMLLEGMSIRSCERLTGMNRDTILSLMVEAGENCRRFMETTISKVPAQYIECDEQWAFIFCKRRTAEQKGLDQEQVGDRYVFHCD